MQKLILYVQENQCILRKLYDYFGLQRYLVISNTIKQSFIFMYIKLNCIS